MGFFERLFRKKDVPIDTSSPDKVKDELDDWELLPAYVEASPEDYQLVSLIATAIAAGDKPDSQFVVKRILQRNPEALTVSLIASGIASGDRPDSQFSVKSIYTKK